MLSSLEDKQDARDVAEAKIIMARVKAGQESLVPGEVAHAILGGEHPVRAWRRYRKMTAEKLAQKVGISRAYVTQIEGGKRKGGLDLYRAFAKALRTEVESLVE